MRSKLTFRCLLFTVPSLILVTIGCTKMSETTLLNKNAPVPTPEPIEHTVQVKAYDAAGNVGQSSITFGSPR